MLHPKKYLIFDLDHTLVRLEIDWSTYRREIFDLVATFDKPLTELVLFTPFAGLELSNRVIKKHGEFAKKKINAFVEKYETTHYAGYTPNTELLSFIRTHAKKNYRFFIWTSNARKTFDDLLIKEHVQDVFTRIVDRCAVSLLKPEIDGFKLIQIPHAPLNDYLMIGDNFTDEGAAEKAGIDFFKVNYFHR